VEQDCPPFLNTWRGVEHGTGALLGLLADEGVPATFFTTGQVADRFPDVVRAIVAAGHELGCHGNTHRVFTELDERAASEEIETASAVLRQFAPVIAFRAPNLRFPPTYLPLLERNGYRIDSSGAKYKIASDRAASSSAIIRVPASVTSSVLRLPRFLRERYLALLADPVVLFVHPWEFVDLTRERLRIDCRFRTGDKATTCVAEVLRYFKDGGATFHLMRDLVP
jgi:peptidoglycan/xylan/chitin deacetylase (PgdA/CDA1 family)